MKAQKKTDNKTKNELPYGSSEHHKIKFMLMHRLTSHVNLVNIDVKGNP